MSIIVFILGLNTMTFNVAKIKAMDIATSPKYLVNIIELKLRTLKCAYAP